MAGAGLDILLGTKLGTQLGTDLSPHSGHTILSAASVLGTAYHSDFRADDPNRAMAGSKVAGLYNYGLDASDALQGIDSLRPTYNATAFNGGPGIVGNAIAGAYLQANTNTAFVSGSRPYCWLVVQLTDSALQYIAGLLDTNPNGSGYNYLHAIDTSSPWTQDRGSNDGATNVSGPTVDTNRHLIEYGLTAGGTASLVVDGVAFNSSKSGGAQGALAVVTLLGLIGPAKSNAILARFIAATSVTAQQVTDMRAYLRGNNFPNYSGSNYGVP